MTLKAVLAGAVLAGAACVASAALGANIVQDGDFSSPSGGASYTTYTAGSSFGPWLVTKGSVDLIGGYWQAPNNAGGSVDIDGAAPGGISQDLVIGPGEYELTFFISGNPDGPPKQKGIAVSVGNQVNQLFQYTIGSNTHSDMMWLPETLKFTATGPTTLSFGSVQANISPYGAAIGGVGVSAIPEPAMWTMMLLGLGGLGVMLRARRSVPTLAAG